MVNHVIVEAPCKINVHLAVLGKRADGYHDLESIFIALGFGDTLGFKVLDTDGGCEIHMDGPPAPGENLIYKAVSVFRKYTGFPRSVSIDVSKRIPMGAGLGGASSNAASTLLALNTLGNCGLGSPELHKMALELGSDVPFFLNPGAAFVSGRGEHIEPVKGPDNLWVVLLKPGFSSSTPEAFRMLDTYRKSAPKVRAPRERLISALCGNPGDWPYKNDFLDLFLTYGREDQKDTYRRILDALQGTGALYAGLSGSGSTCFGIFKDQGVAERALRILNPSWSFIVLTFPLARSGIAVLQ